MESSSSRLEPASEERREAALEVLLAERLAPIVEMVLFSPASGSYEARAIDGRVAFRRQPAARGWSFEIDEVDGRNPLEFQDPSRFATLSSETTTLYPSPDANSYPFGFEHTAQVFDHPCAPDLVVVHSASHRYGGNIGQHGSLDVVQARAPFVISGAGVRQHGMLDGHCRLVDVAPTVLALLGVPRIVGMGANGSKRDDALLARQDGERLTELIASESRAKHVAAVLFDGCNSNVLYEMAASGEAPNVARLIETGTALRHGAIASLPTVTLANHTTLLTGCHPGHHGVLHNAWYDRTLDREVVTESPATWHEAMRWLTPGTETIHEALKRARPESVTISVNEPADRGADYSTFELFRNGRSGVLVPDMSELPVHTSRTFADSNELFRWWSFVDTVGLRQTCSVWEGHHLGVDYPAPTFSWTSFSLTDSASHAGGPHSEIARAAVRDTDARLGDLIAAIERAGVLGDTAVLLVSDHGMEQSHPDVVGDWGDALSDAGISFTDESSGFLYLTG